MRHETYEEWILLSLLGELAEDERRDLEAHVAVCAACRTELEEARAYVARIGEARAGSLPAGVLHDARRELRRALGTAVGEGGAHRAARRERRGWLDWLSPARVALAGTAAVAIGFVAGYIAFGRMDAGMQTMVAEGPPAGNGLLSGAGKASSAGGVPGTRAGLQEIGGPSYRNVRVAGIDPRSNEVEIEYDMIRPARLKAGIDDERVRRILAEGVTNDANPAARLQAIQTIGAYLEAPHGEEIKQALIRAVKTDPNAGVRKQALFVLYRMPFDADIKDACLHVLAGDENEGLRIAAINILGLAMLDGHVDGGDVFEAVGARLRNDENGFIRVQSGAFLQEVNGHED